MEDGPTSHSKENMHHKYAGGRISHLASGSDGSELFFSGLFVLFPFLKESLRDFDVLHDQRMSFRSCSRESMIVTVALGTLDRTQDPQHSYSRSGDTRENLRCRWGHYG